MLVRVQSLVDGIELLTGFVEQKIKIHYEGFSIFLLKGPTHIKTLVDVVSIELLTSFQLMIKMFLNMLVGEQLLSDPQGADLTTASAPA